MKVDKYRDMALRNPIGCTWWSWLGGPDGKGEGWRKVAQRVRMMGVARYYGFDRDCDVEKVEEVVKKVLPIMVWDIGMDSWWLKQGIPREVAQGDPKIANLVGLREDILRLRREFGSLSGSVDRSSTRGMFGRVPAECSYIDDYLENVRVQLKV